ncbi:DUF5133 domain-containing protein [Streptomyces qinzhouensis]|uniref:DUF5133 domain-containing protein n=1 Tax=Streptomyces qinzhouensis TaxID=2599401 RepID=A0A5B8JF32_9ACTN|nr:DUF5133 domain-containing protein [Streptomyces qinzhouensis]QDY80227.1 DUF5133 domain-containing protein [Streptomyces qinzhouensis]
MVLEPDPNVVRELVHRYDALTAPDVPRADASTRTRLEGIVYTLRVLTGAGDESKALSAARGLVSGRDGGPHSS